MTNLLRLAALLTVVFATNVSAQDNGEQKAVLVTGASSGIGLRIAETLAGTGFYVYAGARKDEDLARLDAMDNISSVRLDVTVQEDIDAAVEFVRSEGRGLWGIVNNAGIVRYSPLVSGPESELILTFNVNVFGPYRINQAFLPFVVESGGRTATISSINGFLPSPGAAGYAASKFAVEGYTDSLAAELAETGVHVAVVPSKLHTTAIGAPFASREIVAGSAPRPTSLRLSSIAGAAVSSSSPGAGAMKLTAGGTVST